MAEPLADRRETARRLERHVAREARRRGREAARAPRALRLGPNLSGISGLGGLFNLVALPLGGTLADAQRHSGAVACAQRDERRLGQIAQLGIEDTHEDVGVERVSVRLLEGGVEPFEGARGAEQSWCEQAHGRESGGDERATADGKEQIPHAERRLGG